MAKPFFSLILLALVTTPAFAVPTLQPRLRDHEIRAGLEARGYLTPVNEPTGDNGSGNLALTVGVRGVGDKNDLHYGVEGESLFGLKRASYHYVDVGELYVGYEKKRTGARVANDAGGAGPFVYLGRKRFEWNALDTYWSLGLFEPRFRWDYLNERENGLMGLFFGWNTELVQITSYVTPISIPEQGAPFDITGGNCHSSSPWFSCPASTISIFNQPTSVNFTLDVPPVKDLVLHEGHGATIRLGRESGPWTRLSYAHKPMNQFLLAFEGRLDLTNSTVPAVIRPRVIYHDLYGADAGWKGERNAFVASALLEKPIRDVTPSTWNTQEVVEAKIYGATFVTFPFSSLKFSRLEASYFHRDGGDTADKGPFVGGLSYFEPRYAFQNAFSLAAFSPIRDDWSRRFLLAAKFIVDTAYTGNLLELDSFYSPAPHLVLDLGADLIGSNNPTPVDFLSRYQRNDRIRGGVTYTF